MSRLIITKYSKYDLMRRSEFLTADMAVGIHNTIIAAKSCDFSIYMRK